MEEIIIDKLEVVCRQIKEAVRLFFEERDRVVIHTIIASAHQILFDLGKQTHVKSVVRNTEELRKPEIQKYLRTINYPYNFFKHADRDSAGRINIGPLDRLTSDFIMDAIVMLQQTLVTFQPRQKFTGTGLFPSIHKSSITFRKTV